MSTQVFGALLRRKRLDKLLTLREFSRLINYDASNLSKIERGVNPPPPTIMLKSWAPVLGLEPGTQEYQAFLDQAQISRDEIPDDVPSGFRNILLPALLRTVRSEPMTKDQYERLVKLLNK